MKYNTYQDRLVQLVTTAQQNTIHVILSLLEFHSLVAMQLRWCLSKRWFN